MRIQDSILLAIYVVALYVGYVTRVMAEGKIEESLSRDLLTTKYRERVIVLMRPDRDAPNGGKSLSAPASYVQEVLGASATNVKQIGGFAAVAVEINSNELDKLAEDPNIAKIVRDVPMKPTLMDSVPLIGADLLHKAGHVGASISVAVLDTGVDPTHPAMKNVVIAQACFSTTESTVYDLESLCPSKLDAVLTGNAAAGCPQDVEGCEHGTHVAGIVAGRNMDFNGKKFDGVAPGANIVAVQVFTLFKGNDICGRNDKCVMSFTSDQLRALDWVYKIVKKTDSKIKIASVNMSLGSGYFDKPCDSTSALTEIIERLKAKRVPTVVAAGNDGYYDGISEPACISSAYAVAAMTKNGEIDYSYSNISSQIRFAAPGTGIVSSVLGGTYRALSGTSMAAPHVAGAFALLREEFPNLSLTELEAKLDLKNKVVQDQKNGGAFRIIALTDGNASKVANGDQPVAGATVGNVSSQSADTHTQPQIPAVLPTSGSVIVKTPLDSGTTSETISKHLESISNVEANVKKIAPNAYTVDISPVVQPNKPEESTREAAARNTVKAIETLKAIEGVQVFENRLSVPK